MTEGDLRQRFGTLVKHRYVPFDIDCIEDSILGIKRQIEDEPDFFRRKELRKIRKDLQVLMKHFL